MTPRSFTAVLHIRSFMKFTHSTHYDRAQAVLYTPPWATEDSKTLLKRLSLDSLRSVPNLPTKLPVKYFPLPTLLAFKQDRTELAWRRYRLLRKGLPKEEAAAGLMMAGIIPKLPARYDRIMSQLYIQGFKDEGEFREHVVDLFDPVRGIKLYNADGDLSCRVVTSSDDLIEGLDPEGTLCFPGRR
jgi:hypothetical protein